MIFYGRSPIILWAQFTIVPPAIKKSARQTLEPHPADDTIKVGRMGWLLMSSNDAAAPERPQSEVLATADATTVAPAQAVESAALPATSAPHATLDAVRRDIEEMRRELQANLGNLEPDDHLALAEPLGQLAAAAATASAPRSPAVISPMTTSMAALVWSMAAISAWIVLFAAGVSIPAAPYITLLDHMAEGKTSTLALLGSGAMVVLCSTYTNPGILACLAAFLGGVSKGVRSGGASTAEFADASPTPVADCLSAVVRGFFLYLVLLSGLLLLTTKAITDGTQEQYVQLAGTVSVLAFMVGYDADFFFRIMRRLDDWTQQSASQRGTGADRQPR